MPFIRLELGPTTVVLGTVRKTMVEISLGPAAIRAVGWSDDEPNVLVSVGTGEDAGWVRLAVDEEGESLQLDDAGRLTLVLPRSAVPDLAACRSAPLTWRRGVDGGIEVRLPTVGVPAFTRPRVVAGGRAVPSLATEPEDDRPTAIAPPDLYANFHREAWAAGIELTFLSDGNCAVGSRVLTIEDAEVAVRRAIDQRSSDRARAS